jgi:GNAT superfamily N-acetyltransferase
MTSTTVHLERMIHSWATRLDLEPDVLRRAGTRVIARQDLTTRKRVIVYTFGHGDVILTPPRLQTSTANALDLSARLEPETLLRILPGVLKPLWLDFAWYADQEPPAAPSAVRVLNPSDAALLEALNDACSETEQELGDVQIDQPLVVGWLEDGQLLAAASQLLNGEIADIGVLTHPDARGRGLGRAVVAETIRLSMRAGLTVQYTTQEQNLGSRNIAARLGLRLFCDERGYAVTP